MARAGQTIEGPEGFRLRLIRIDDEVLEMEATYAGSGSLPPEHLHPRQAEHFEVLEGTVRAVVDGAERRYEAGDTFDVPPGTPHQMTAEGPSRVRWEVRPALRTPEFFERLYGSGPGSAREDIGAFLQEFSEEIRITAASS